MLDDDARYQCQVSPGPLGQPGIRSHFATLTVLVPPDPPKIVQGDYLVTTEDREIELECVSYGGKPAAEITWIDGLGKKKFIDTKININLLGCICFGAVYKNVILCYRQCTCGWY